MMTDPSAKEHRVSETDQMVRVPEDKAIQARFKDLLAHVERRKSDRGYFERWEEQVAEYRREVQEEAERELAEEGTTGAQDCRIAAQAVAHDMTVITRNIRDFSAIGVRCEDWSL